MDRRFYALTFVSEDRPGIVSDVTKVLYENGFNIEDSSSTLLRGIFAMILIVSTREDIDEAAIQKLFSPLNYMTISVKRIDRDVPEIEGESYSISVYGADKAGIVYNVSKFLSDRKINIVDLQTKVAGKKDKPIYIMILEVIVPKGVDGGWIDQLKEISRGMGIDISVKSIETFEF
ncbi:glycine cleavage system protein R [Calditerrivibrio nitroreducens]|uniref:Amino acid-binding ACT domain protein n=1 Tax=Calditerrivibrio nitroreducens (strain DSM 19672 / NBRC 101217 / Yu37-1) TaxID=768670 RepID=E4TJ81_CALNY|nr:ACT domain-containing protein [Calditerrivibrio nitroreducens]ADR18117.1 amino acid-binding ACT domain protein [Calditerrivibrio nitroreducens DSM 19672]